MRGRGRVEGPAVDPAMEADKGVVEDKRSVGVASSRRWRRRGRHVCPPRWWRRRGGRARPPDRGEEKGGRNLRAGGGEESAPISVPVEEEEPGQPSQRWRRRRALTLALHAVGGEEKGGRHPPAHQRRRRWEKADDER